MQVYAQFYIKKFAYIKKSTNFAADFIKPHLINTQKTIK